MTESECDICLRDFPLHMVSFSCGHAACVDCARSWLTRSRECPFCKEPVYRVHNSHPFVFLHPHDRTRCDIDERNGCAHHGACVVASEGVAAVEGLRVGDGIRDITRSPHFTIVRRSPYRCARLPLRTARFRVCGEHVRLCVSKEPFHIDDEVVCVDGHCGRSAIANYIGLCGLWEHSSHVHRRIAAAVLRSNHVRVIVERSG